MIGKVFAVLEAQGITCERVDIAHQPLRGCTACYGCVKNKEGCVLPDDFNEWFHKAKAADAILIGSPTYFANVSAETKAFLDRLGLVARVTGALRRKPLGAIVAVVLLFVKPWRRVTGRVDQHHRILVEPDEGGRSVVQRVEDHDEQLRKLEPLPGQVAALTVATTKASDDNQEILRQIADKLDAMTEGDE